MLFNGFGEGFKTSVIQTKGVGREGEISVIQTMGSGERVRPLIGL